MNIDKVKKLATHGMSCLQSKNEKKKNLIEMEVLIFLHGFNITNLR